MDVTVMEQSEFCGSSLNYAMLQGGFRVLCRFPLRVLQRDLFAGISHLRVVGSPDLCCYLAFLK